MWSDLAYARGAWPDARKMSDTRLTQLLTAAHELCAGYAPVLPVTDPPTDPPGRYKEAEVLAARAIWTAARQNGDAGIGLDDGTIQLATGAVTLDGQVKQLLRPPGAPRIG